MISLSMISLSYSCSLGSDNINPIIIKNTITHFAPQLEYIFYLSFTTGNFPKLLKDAIVTPIYKNGSNKDPNNYRPISILTIFSKLLEKLVHNRLLKFINNNYVLHDNQFGFRADKSTTIATAHVLIIKLIK